MYLLDFKGPRLLRIKSDDGGLIAGIHPAERFGNPWETAKQIITSGRSDGKSHWFAMNLRVLQPEKRDPHKCRTYIVFSHVSSLYHTQTHVCAWIHGDLVCIPRQIQRTKPPLRCVWACLCWVPFLSWFQSKPNCRTTVLGGGGSPILTAHKHTTPNNMFAASGRSMFVQRNLKS